MFGYELFCSVSCCLSPVFIDLIRPLDNFGKNRYLILKYLCKSGMQSGFQYLFSRDSDVSGLDDHSHRNVIPVNTYLTFGRIELDHMDLSLKESPVGSDDLKFKILVILCHNEPPLLYASEYIIYAAGIKEVALGYLIMHTFDDLLESSDSL